MQLQKAARPLSGGGEGEAGSLLLEDFGAANQFTLVAEPPVLTGGIREPLGERFDHLRAALEIHPFGQELTCLAVKR